MVAKISVCISRKFQGTSTNFRKKPRDTQVCTPVEPYNPRKCIYEECASLCGTFRVPRLQAIQFDSHFEMEAVVHEILAVSGCRIAQFVVADEHVVSQTTVGSLPKH